MQKFEQSLGPRGFVKHCVHTGERARGDEFTRCEHDPLECWEATTPLRAELATADLARSEILTTDEVRRCSRGIGQDDLCRSSIAGHVDPGEIGAEVSGERSRNEGVTLNDEESSAETSSFHGHMTVRHAPI